MRCALLSVNINADEHFEQHAQVADAASAVTAEDLGEGSSVGARVSVGVASLPGGAPAEVQLICALSRIDNIASETVESPQTVRPNHVLR